MTIEDVANQAGVSKGTVSAVLNSKNTIKPRTIDHILEVMKELNFRPRGVARNLKNGVDDKSIGIIIRDLNYPFYTTTATGVAEYARGREYHLIVTSSENNHESDKKFTHCFPPKTSKAPSSPPLWKARRKSSICSN